MTYYRGFGGGFGLGTPVVSYAPRPMLINTRSLVIMKAIEGLGERVSWSVLRRRRKKERKSRGARRCYIEI